MKGCRVRRSDIDQSASADPGEWDHFDPAELANISTLNKVGRASLGGYAS